MVNLKSLLLKNTAYNLIGHIYLGLANLISIPLILKGLGTKQFSLLALIITLVNFSSILNLGLNQATIRYLSLTTDKLETKNRYFQTSFFLSLGIAVTIFFLNLLLAPWLTSYLHLSISLFYLTISLVIINFFTNFFNTLPQANNDFAFYNFKTLIVGTTNTFITAFLSLKLATLPPILTARLVAQTLTLILQTIYANKFSITLKPHYHLTQARQLIAYSSKKFLGILSTRGTFYLPRLFIATFLPIANLALFTIPQGLIANLQAILAQLTAALFPLSTNLVAQRQSHRLKKLILATQTLVFFSLVILIFLVFQFGETFLTFWLKKPTLAHQIAPILKILVLAYSLPSLSAIPATILDAFGKPEIPAQFATLNLLLQLCFLPFFLLHYSLIGIPLAILTHNSIQVPLFLYRFNKEINFPSPDH